MKRCILIALTAMLCCTGVPDSAGAQYQTEIVNLSSKGRLQISDVYVNMAAVALYDKFEITFELSGTWDNPFDPDQIAVEAHFQSPSGEDIVVPGFFYQDYKRTVREGEDFYSVVGDPVWKIRFAPTEVGLYIYTITAQSAGHTVRTESQTLEGTARTNHHGYVRVSKTNPRYFEHDDGTSFFAVGMDMAWRPLVELDQVYTDFARAGGTLNRLFLSGRQRSVEERINYAGPRPDKGLGKRV